MGRRGLGEEMVWWILIWGIDGTIHDELCLFAWCTVLAKCESRKWSVQFIVRTRGVR